MERSTMMKTIACSFCHQKHMFDSGELPAPFISFPQKGITTIRDASFSTYLKTQQLDNHAEASEISIFYAENYFNESSSCDPRPSKKVSTVNTNLINPGSISKRCDFSSVPKFSSPSSSLDGSGRNYKAHSFHATPTASSEASWNSQTGLLSTQPGALAISIRNPSSGVEKKKVSATKWLLGVKCPCSGKKSIQVEEKLSEPRRATRLECKSKDARNIERRSPETIKKCSVTDHWLQKPEVIPSCHRISADINHIPSGPGGHRALATAGRPFTDDTRGFSFPILNQTSSSSMELIVNGLPPPINYKPPQLADSPRHSLEVFRPPDDPISNKSAMDLHRRPSFTFPASPKSGMTIAEDDMASDASSDLFEIESFSTQTTSYPMYNHWRDLLDEAFIFNARRLSGTNGGGLHCRHSVDESSVAPIECYEPSEASIDWSVITAEGFHRASVTNFSITASEAEEMTIVRQHESDKSSGGGNRRGTGGLLSCRCEKAVSVGPNPLKYTPADGQREGSLTLRNLTSRPPITNKPPVARSHSARLCLPFAT